MVSRSATMLVAVLVTGGVLTGCSGSATAPATGQAEQASSPTAMSTPITTASPSQPRRLNAAEATTLWKSMRRGIEEAGTLEVRLSYAQPTTSSSETASTLPAMFNEVDLRDPATPKVRLSRVTPPSTTPEPAFLMVGDQAWLPSSPGSESPTTHQWAAASPLDRESVVTSPFFWAVDPVDTIWEMGTGTVDGVSAQHIIVSSGKDDLGNALSPTAKPTDGRGLLDLWVATASGRVLRAQVDHDYDTLIADPITYGADISITSPPADGVAPSAPATPR